MVSDVYIYMYNDLQLFYPYIKYFSVFALYTVYDSSPGTCSFTLEMATVPRFSAADLAEFC